MICLPPGWVEHVTVLQRNERGTWLPPNGEWGMTADNPSALAASMAEMGSLQKVGTCR